jgi:outer membrane murein-binding lipoprotein Lpp
MFGEHPFGGAMTQRILVLSAAAFAAAWLGGCASKSEESVADAARAACEAQKGELGADLSACIAQMEETVRAARAFRHEAPHPARGKHS